MTEKIKDWLNKAHQKKEMMGVSINGAELFARGFVTKMQDETFTLRKRISKKTVQRVTLAFKQVWYVQKIPIVDFIGGMGR